jgi:hypothetical protein
MTIKTEVPSNIVNIRSLEDSIRSTKKYTEGIETMRKTHPAYPIQGEGFPSKVFCKYYEVYPNTEISWDMPAGIALDLLWGDVARVDVLFKYDYRTNKASMVVKDGEKAVELLAKTVPRFRDALTVAIAAMGGEKAVTNKTALAVDSDKGTRIILTPITSTIDVSRES